tara:strand:+ start:2561 stop:2734 length:174 start_codon:yes stop_codon:yes gene_type:complete
MKKKIEARIEYWDIEIKKLEAQKIIASSLVEKIHLSDEIIIGMTVVYNLQLLLLDDG